MFEQVVIMSREISFSSLSGLKGLIKQRTFEPTNMSGESTYKWFVKFLKKLFCAFLFKVFRGVGWITWRGTP